MKSSQVKEWAIAFAILCAWMGADAMTNAGQFFQ